jgi:hypothetical protein
MVRKKLTAFLEEPEIKMALNDCFAMPESKTRKPSIKFPASIGVGVVFSEVGCAYDYWVRCWRVILNNLETSRIYDFKGIMYFFGKSQLASDLLMDYRLTDLSGEYYSTLDRPHDADADELLVRAGNYLAAIRNFVNLEPSTVDPSDETAIEALLFFAKFECELRSGLPTLSFDAKAQNISELRGIMASSDYTWAHGNIIELNPAFGLTGKNLAIGADGDLLIDGCLIELKTSGRIQLKKDIRQLLSYYILNKLRDKSLYIDAVSVYYPRYDLYKRWSISDLMTPSQEERLRQYMKKWLG